MFRPIACIFSNSAVQLQICFNKVELVWVELPVVSEATESDVCARDKRKKRRRKPQGMTERRLTVNPVISATEAVTSSSNAGNRSLSSSNSNLTKLSTVSSSSTASVIGSRHPLFATERRRAFTDKRQPLTEKLSYLNTQGVILKTK